MSDPWFKYSFPTIEPHISAEWPTWPIVQSYSKEEASAIITHSSGQAENSNPHISPTNVIESLGQGLDHRAGNKTTSPAQDWRFRYKCRVHGCNKSFEQSEYRTRHQKTTHGDRSRFLCHFRRCPRGIKGRGFPRKDKLVDHLKSRYHKLSHGDARYEAALHNPAPPPPDISLHPDLQANREDDHKKKQARRLAELKTAAEAAQDADITKS